MKYETKELTSETRSKLPGSFIKLTDGYTHYELTGPEEGNLIVLVHGFVTPYFAWDKQIEEFTKQGFQVLRYDLFGRGFSDRPNKRYDNNLFVRQLHELLTELKFQKHKIILVGWSMGGAISINFTNTYPEVVSKLILVAPIGLPSPGLSSAILFKIPLLRKIIFYNFGHKIMRKRIESVLQIEDTNSDEFKRVVEQMEFKGFLKALLLTGTQMNIYQLGDVYKEVGKLEMVKMLIWGESDDSVSFKLHTKVIEYLPGIIFHPMKDVGHAPQYNNSRKFNE
ncbi:MAG: alpha/beta hydrolase, partial [Candidatus Heimdallarchaeota archaeon]|nr:alpha/beta hydrolase [Candidatus Heimdallarchaeota archaeon]